MKFPEYLRFVGTDNEQLSFDIRYCFDRMMINGADWGKFYNCTKDTIEKRYGREVFVVEYKRIGNG